MDCLVNHFEETSIKLKEYVRKTDVVGIHGSWLIKEGYEKKKSHWLVHFRRKMNVFIRKQITTVTVFDGKGFDTLVLILNTF